MSRRLALVLPLCLVALAGCAPGKSDIDKAIRDEMKTSMNVEITSTNLSKQADGGYTGTATAANGDVYDVVTSASVKGTEWKAFPGQTMMEREIRQDLEAQSKMKLQSLTLTKQGIGAFTGTAVFEDGTQVKVSTKIEGTRVVWDYEPIP